MTARRAILVAVLALIALLGFLTIDVLIRDGITPLIVVSLGILALFCFGAVGALLEDPRE
jgi:hypothetical protein